MNIASQRAIETHKESATETAITTRVNNDVDIRSFKQNCTALLK